MQEDWHNFAYGTLASMGQLWDACSLWTQSAGAYYPDCGKGQKPSLPYTCTFLHPSGCPLTGRQCPFCTGV